MATEFNDNAHYGFFKGPGPLTSGNGFQVRQSELTLAALRAAGVLDTMVDGVSPPAIDSLWLDKNTDPAVLKIYDSTGFAWVPVTFDTLFNRGINTLKVTPFAQTVNTPNAYTVAKPTLFSDGLLFSIVPTANNTANTFITVQGVGTYPVMYPNDAYASPNEFVAGRIDVLLYQNSNFYVLTPSAEAYNAQLAAEAAAGQAQAAVDEIAGVVASAVPITDIPFTVSLGQTQVTLPSGYSVVAYVFLEGFRISGWNAPGEGVVTFSAITSADTNGAATAEMIVGAGIGSIYAFDTLDGGQV